MRFRGSMIQMGRWEDSSVPREHAVRSELSRHAKRAERLLADGWLTRLGRALGRQIKAHEAWGHWNVATVEGWPPRKILFQHWDGFGTDVFPVFVKQIRYVPGVDLVQIEQGLLTDPSILHYAWDLLSERGVPYDERNMSLRQGWLSAYRTFGAQFARTGLCDHPRAQTLQGLEQMLALRRLRVKTSAYGVPKLERVVA